MLTSLSLTNFKPFKAEQKARLAPLTLIYGPNSSGKSSIIQSILLLKQSKESLNRPGRTRARGPLNPAGPGHNFGSIRALLHGQKAIGRFKIGIGWKFNQSDLSYHGENIVEPMNSDVLIRDPFSYNWSGPLTDLSCEFTFRLSQAENEHNRHWLDRVSFGFGEDGDTPDHFQKLTLMQPVTISPIEPSGSFRFAERNSNEWLMDKLEYKDIDKYDFFSDTVRDTIGHQLYAGGSVDGVTVEVGDSLIPYQPDWRFNSRVIRGLIRLDSSNFIPPGQTDSRPNVGHVQQYLNWANNLNDLMSGVNQTFQVCLDDVIYLGPLRTPTPRGQIVYSDFGVQNEVGATGDNTAPVFYQAPDHIKDQINKVFQQMRLNYQIVIENTGERLTGEFLQLILRNRKNDPVARTTDDVGFGVSQILPILIQGKISFQKTILVEQPEIHLHPRLQADLADFFVDTCNQNRNQWIIETHSELLMLRLKRHIRAGRIRASDVCVLYVDPDDESAQSEILELRLDEQGEFLDEWPDGFFEDSYYEIQE